eukprot:scaffold2150_cov137-Isochrysis_galbana.AAC.3
MGTRSILGTTSWRGGTDGLHKVVGPRKQGAGSILLVVIEKGAARCPPGSRGGMARPVLSAGLVCSCVRTCVVASRRGTTRASNFGKYSRRPAAAGGLRPAAVSEFLMPPIGGHAPRSPSPSLPSPVPRSTLTPKAKAHARHDHDAERTSARPYDTRHTQVVSRHNDLVAANSNSAHTAHRTPSQVVGSKYPVVGRKWACVGDCRGCRIRYMTQDTNYETKEVPSASREYRASGRPLVSLLASEIRCRAVGVGCQASSCRQNGTHCT